MSGPAGNNERPQEGNAGFVYIIQAIGTARVKLGYSIEPEKRLRELQTGSPYELALLSKWRARPATERRLHREFAEYRVKGEWFELPRQLIERLAVSDQETKTLNTSDTKLWRLETYKDRHGKVRVRKVLRFVPKPGVAVEMGAITDELAAEIEKQRGRGRWRESRIEAQTLRIEAIAIADIVKFDR
jgi:hypothetical protein